MDDRIGLSFKEQYASYSNSWTQLFQSVCDHNKFRNQLSSVEDSWIKFGNFKNESLNASLVKVDNAERKYILIDEPLATITDFWTMIWEQNSRSIIMLDESSSVDKCEKYWPKENDTPLKFDHLDLHVEFIQVIENDKKSNIIVKEFKMKSSKEERKILLFHTSMMITRIESVDFFLDFLFTCRCSGYLNSNKYGPAIVHSTKEIAQSASFILLDSYLILLKNSMQTNQQEPNLVKLIIEMRNRNVNHIKTHVQLEFIFKVIDSAIKSRIFEQEESEIRSIKTKLILGEKSNLSDANCAETELRRRAREEKKQITLNHIKRIKDKQKEIDTWNHRSKFIKYASFSLFFIGLCIGTLYYKSIAYN